MSVHDSDFQCDSPDNVSDHLPVSVTVYVPKKGDPNTASPPACPMSVSESVPLPWHNEIRFQQLHSQEVTRVLERVEIPHMDSVNKENASDVVDTLCEQICAALHESINALVPFKQKPNSENINHVLPCLRCHIKGCHLLFQNMSPCVMLWSHLSLTQALI